MQILGELLPSHGSSAYRGSQNEQILEEFYHYRCLYLGFNLIWHRLMQHYFYQEILEKFSARQLRLAFLTQLWNSKVDFSESLMTGEVRNLEVTINVST